MTRAMLQRRLNALSTDERGFTIIETVIAITVIFAAMVALAYTATIGFKSIAYSRERVTANGVADRIMEEIRGLEYAKIQTGLSNSDLGSDPNIVNCSGIYRFESCATGEKIVSSGGVSTTTWINPHQGTIASSVTTNRIPFTWQTYITNNDSTTQPYRVTLIVSWASAAYPNKANNLIRIQSLFASPSGCVSSATHPFAAPCQPFFYGVAQVPAGQILVTGSIQGLTFSSGYLQLTGTESNLQNEQVTEGRGTFTESQASLTDGGGTYTEGGGQTTASAADSDPGNPGATYATASLGSGVGGTVTSVNGSTSIGFQAPSGDSGTVDSGVAAAGANVCPPPTDIAEADLLPCIGGRIQQGGTLSASMTLDGIVSGLGTINLASVASAAANPNKSFVDREAVSGESGRVELTSTRRIGTLSVGALPAALGTPAGWTGALVTLTNYQDSATSQAGTTTTAAPATSVSGTVSFWNGVGYTSYAVNNASLNNIASTVTRSAVIGGRTVVGTVSVNSGSQSATTGTNQTNPSGSLRTDVDSSVTPFKATIHYVITVDGVTTVDLAIAINLGTMLTRGVYGQPPAAG
jgi:type II secretory pathway pseudopilin PulG